jgi:hypothetical protein
LKFKIDENLPAEAAAALRAFGYEADTVGDELLSGAEDHTISERVRSEARILITLDLDFANVRNYPPGEHPGIVVLRVKTQDKENVLAYIKRLAMVLRNRHPVGEFWIVDRDRIRFRLPE